MTVDITCLSPSSAWPAKGEMPMGKGLEGGFGPPLIATEKLAPPGAAPPLIPGLWPMGEEGAKLEPIAPPQNPDFFPTQLTDGVAAPFDGVAPRGKSKKTYGPSDPECRIGPAVPDLIAGFAAQEMEKIAAFGPIVVPFPPVSSDDVPMGLDPKKPSVSPMPPMETMAFEGAEGLTGQPLGASVPADVTPFELQAPPEGRPGAKKENPAPMPPEAATPPVARKESRRRGEYESAPPVAVKTDARREPPVPMPPEVVPPASDPVEGQDAKPTVSDADALLLKAKLNHAGPFDRLTIEPVEAPTPMADLTAAAKAASVEPKPEDRMAARSDDVTSAEPQVASDPTVSGAKSSSRDAQTKEGKSDDAAESESSTLVEAIDNHEAKPHRLESSPLHLREAAPQKVESVGPTPKRLEISDVQTGAILRQVADRLEALAASHAGRKVTIRLEPESLGSITLVVRQTRNDVSAEVYASHESVRAALDVNRPMLASSLEQRGIQLGAMTVGHELPKDSGRQEQAMREAVKQHANLFAATAETRSTLSLDAMRSFARKASGVDLWI